MWGQDAASGFEVDVLSKALSDVFGQAQIFAQAQMFGAFRCRSARQFDTALLSESKTQRLPVLPVSKKLNLVP